MPDSSPHHSGLPSASQARYGLGLFSDQVWPAALGVSDGPAYEDLMAASATSSAHFDPNMTRASSVSLADLTVNSFGENFSAGGPALWKGVDPSISNPFSQMYQYRIPSSEEGQLNHLIAPAEFDIPQVRAISHSRISAAGRQQSQASSREESLVQNHSTAINVAGESIIRKPEPVSDESNFVQAREAVRELSSAAPTISTANVETQPSKINRTASGAEETVNSMENTETLNSPQVASVNEKPGASTSLSVNSESNVVHRASSAERHARGRADFPEQSHARNRQSLLPTVATSPTLPAGKVFPIQIGSELFKLSGASISSDGKSPLAQSLE